MAAAASMCTRDLDSEVPQDCVTPLSEARGPYRQGGGNFSQTLY